MAMWQARQVDSPAPLSRRDRRVLHVVGAVAALLLVAGLVIRGTVSLTRAPDERIVTVDTVTGQVLSGGVQLTPGRVRPMFPDVHLEPGVARSACIEVAHDGEVPLDTVALRLDATEGSSLLLDRLVLGIERGAPGVGDDCTGFSPVADVASGRLLDLTEPPSPAGWSSWRPAGNEVTSYRFTVLLPDDAAVDALQGTRARVDFLWVATAEPAGGLVAPRMLMLLLAVARDALLPLLLLVVVAVLFLGVQDRIDRRDPKLARAAVHEEPRTFRDAASSVQHARRTGDDRLAAIASARGGSHG